MTPPESLRPNWIHSRREKAGFEKANPPLVEKMIYALALVEYRPELLHKSWKGIAFASRSHHIQ